MAYGNVYKQVTVPLSAVSSVDIGGMGVATGYR
jgi:hypothetical protein